MRAYHGTTAAGLQTLRPSFAGADGNLRYPCVYLTTDRALAALYLWKHPFKWLNYGFNNGRVVYTESFAHALREFYGGVCGCVYTCEGAFTVDADARIPSAVISRADVPVLECDEVPDAYERILQYERGGLLEIRRFENLTEAQQASERRMIAQTVRRDAWNGALQAFLREKFPEVWAAEHLSARPMGLEDVEIVTDLLREPQVETALHAGTCSRRVLEENLRDADEANFTLYRGGAPAGWLRLNGLEGGTAWLSMLAIFPKFQKQGIGGYAVQFAENFARSKGFAALNIHTTTDNLPAQTCYEKHGYVLIETGPCTNGDGQERIGITYHKSI